MPPANGQGCGADARHQPHPVVPSSHMTPRADGASRSGGDTPAHLDATAVLRWFSDYNQLINLPLQTTQTVLSWTGTRTSDPQSTSTREREIPTATLPTPFQLSQMVSQGNLGAMEPQDPQEFILDVFADPASVRDVVRGTFLRIYLRGAARRKCAPHSSEGGMTMSNSGGSCTNPKTRDGIESYTGPWNICTDLMR